MLYHPKMAEFEPDPNRPLRVVGRYALYGKLASGGMATVHFGRLLGPVGFSRTVAIKRLHPQFSKDPEFVAMFLDEARLAARIQHPNVVATVDVVAMDEELFLVMDYIRGESFSRLLRGAHRQSLELPEGFIANVVACMLHGLHAAHEATDERGQPLRVVHRDVSPQNVLVGTDGVARVLDFGVAKAAARIQVTRDGQMKGKLAYMSPEQLSGMSVDRRSDVFAAGVVLWEALTGQRLFTGEDASEVLGKILHEPVTPPSSINPKIRRAIDPVVMRALDKNPETRFQSAREFAIAVEDVMQPMSPRAVGEWVERIAGDSLEKRERALAEIESVSSVNELSSTVTPSEPGFMKTLRTQVRGSLGARSRAITTEGDAEEAATKVYRPASSGPPPLPHGTPLPPRTQPLRDASPAVIISEPAVAESTDTGLQANPFKQRSDYGAYALWAGGGMLIVGVVYVVFSLVSVTKEVDPLPIVAATGLPTPSAEPPVQKTQEAAVEPVVLPEADEEPSDDQPDDQRLEIESKKSAKPRARKPKANNGSEPKPKCAQPWYVDEQGIRRIKAGCL